MDFHNQQYEELTKKQKALTTMKDNLYLDKLKGRITDELLTINMTNSFNRSRNKKPMWTPA